MMRAALVVGALALAACSPAGPRAHTPQQWRVCEGGAFPNVSVNACSAVAGDESADPARRAAAFLQRGRLRAEAGDYGRAVADFGRALRLDRTLADAYVERGKVHHERGAFDIAVRDFDAALALNPNVPQAAERREAALAGRTGAFQVQLDQLAQALARDPQNADLLNNRCWLRAINNDDLNAALADCDAALKIEPNSAAALDSRGMVHLKREEFAAAIADYDAALAVDPGRGHYLYGRGIARIRLGQSDAGHGDLAAAEAAEPGIAQTYASYHVTP